MLYSHRGTRKRIRNSNGPWIIVKHQMRDTTPPGPGGLLGKQTEIQPDDDDFPTTLLYLVQRPPEVKLRCRELNRARTQLRVGVKARINLDAVREVFKHARSLYSKVSDSIRGLYLPQLKPLLEAELFILELGLCVYLHYNFNIQ